MVRGKIFWLGCSVLALTCGSGAVARAGQVIVLPGAQNVAYGDIFTPFSSAALPPVGRTYLKAFSRQTDPAPVGTNLVPSVFLQSNGVAVAGPAIKTLTGASTGIPIPKGNGARGFNFIGPPVLALPNQLKSLIKVNGDAEILRSTSGAFSGVAGQEQGALGAPGRSVFSYGIKIGAGAGQAAGSAYDPFTVPGGASYAYAPVLDDTIEVNSASETAGVEFFAVDSNSFTTDTVDNFTDDGTPDSGALWTLKIAENGLATSASQLQVDFELNPADSEISLPTSYLTSLPGYSGGLTTTQIDALVDTQIDQSIDSAFFLDSAGDWEISGDSFLPAGTMYTPAGGLDAVFAFGVDAGVTDVPEPATGGLLVIGLAAAGVLYRKSFPAAR